MQLSKAILIDLGAIFDIPLAVINKHYPHLTEEVANDAKYRLRRSDKMSLVHPAIEDSVYTLAYQGRDTELLKTAKLNMLVSEFRNIVATYLNTAVENNPVMRDCFLVFNVYPYELSIDEIERLAASFKHQAGLPYIDCGFINKSMDELTPAYLKSIHVKAWVTYDYMDWLLCQYGDERLEKDGKQFVGVPEIAIYAPQLIGDELAEKELYADLLEEVKIDVFEAMRVVYADIAEFHFYPVSSFTRLEIKALQQTSLTNMDTLNSLGVECDAVSKVLNQAGQLTANSRAQLDRLVDELINTAHRLKEDVVEGRFDQIRDGLASVRWLSNALYFASPFDQAADTERYIDYQHARLNRDEKSYQATEQHYNEWGVPTIRQSIQDTDEGMVYRCVVAQDTTNAHGSFAKGSVLTPVSKATLRFDPIEEVKVITFEGE